MEPKLLEIELFLSKFKTALEGVAKLRLRRFSGVFWPVFDPNFRGNIRMLILSLKFGSKTGSKEPENRQKLNISAPSKLLLSKPIKRENL